MVTENKVQCKHLYIYICMCIHDACAKKQWNKEKMFSCCANKWKMLEVIYAIQRLLWLWVYTEIKKSSVCDG